MIKINILINFKLNYKIKVYFEAIIRFLDFIYDNYMTILYIFIIFTDIYL